MGQIGSKFASGLQQFTITPQVVVDYFDQMPLGGPSNPIIDISSGPQQTCVVLDDGQVWCWGNASGGALGDLQAQFASFGSSAPRIAAVPVQGSWRASFQHEFGYCQDTIDNDGDGLVDHEDPDCLDGTLFANGGTGNLDGAGNDLETFCSGAPTGVLGIDHVQRWTAPSTGSFEFVVAESAAIVAVYSDRSLGSQLGCYLTSTGSGVTINATAGTDYYVVIDQSLSSAGTYAVSICAGGCP